VVDRDNWTPHDPRPFRKVDVNWGRLPYSDGQVDFLYSRHTLEDLDNPTHFCAEIKRVARAGYIETPSAAAEFCRGVDGGAPPYRGFYHHRCFVWQREGTLLLMPKLPIVEHIRIPPAEEQRLVDTLNDSPITWNNYHLWSGELRIAWVRVGNQDEYAALVWQAVQESIANALAFGEEHGIESARLLCE